MRNPRRISRVLGLNEKQASMQSMSMVEAIMKEACDQACMLLRHRPCPPPVRKRLPLARRAYHLSSS